MTKKLLLVDGNSIVFRAFFAMHTQLDRFTNADGLHTAAIYGFKLMLDHILADFTPDYALVAFDAGKTTFRTKKYADYKAGRAKTPSELSEQFPYVRQLVTASGMTAYELKDYEADDIIGTLAKQGDAAGFDTLVVSGDRDLTQLATAHTTVAVTKKGVTQTEHYTPATMMEKLGVTPEQFIDVKALMGDSSDNYPGVTKIGEKTALNLIKEYDSLDGLYAQVDQMKASKRKENLIKEKEIAYKCQDLARIRRDAPLTVGLKDIAYAGPQEAALVDLYQTLNFKSFLDKMAVDPAGEEVGGEEEIPFIPLTQENLAEVAALKAPLTLHIEQSDPNYHLAAVEGFALGAAGKWYVSTDPSLLQADPLKSLLEDPAVEIDLFNAKAHLVMLHRLGIDLTGIGFDLLLASYLLDPTLNFNDVGELAQARDYHQVALDEEVYGKGAKREIPADATILGHHLAAKVAAVAALKEPLVAELKQNEQWPLYTEIERPLSAVLAQMEINGIAVNAQTLEEMGSKLTERLAELEQSIYQLAGEEFNINSTKQLGVILFEKLGLKPLKKTKTGYSTSVAVLEKLTGDHPIIEQILAYRQISKLQSTYIKGLLKVIHSDGKIHTRYLQTLTVTGRLSSVDPNLQNIPARLEEGRRIRQAFVPSEEGWQIFSADYSQIELRVLAHVTGDKNLQQDFIDGEDIHAATARRIFHLLPDEEVDPNMRRQAKAVNFGIVYGISDYGLAQNIHVTRKQAKEFIQSYFAEFPGVEKYIHEIVATARKQGFVETLTHRRRYLPDINAKGFNQRSFAERTAMNTPIQGSAADIIKTAMIRMPQALKEAGLKARMLLQIHDELVFEAPKEEVAQLAKVVAKVMDSAMDLAVPLKVEEKAGATWYDLKKLD